MRTVIFDIDGTIANIEHRRQWLASKPKNWKAFNAAMGNDLPNFDIIEVMRALKYDDWTILLASGRGEEHRSVTERWLRQSCDIYSIEYYGEVSDSDPPIFYDKLYMRPAGDSRADDIIKSEILDQMRKDGFNPTLAVDDRDRVVKMWRSRGLRCLQCDYGDF